MASTTRRGLSRRTVLGAALLATLAVPLAATPAAADGPTAVTIAGPGLSAPLEVRADADPELFAAVLTQVSWMSAARAQTTAPPEETRGPKYTVVVFVDDQARQSYDLYPLAEGGPRAFRPGKQPDLRKTSNAWFFGRLNMSETLRAAGAPLPARPDPLSGGIGGGVPGADDGDTRAATFDPVADMQDALAQWRHLFLLNGAVLVLIAAGLAGVSLLIRPKA